MFKPNARIFDFILIIALLSFSALIKASSPIPESLLPWKDWVLHGHERSLCPKPYNNDENPLCVWPTTLSVNLEDQKGQFNFKVATYVQDWVGLPGDKNNWPENVKVNGKLYPVLTRQNMPYVFLEPGEYSIDGTFSYDKIPDYLQIPLVTGPVALTLKGTLIEQVDRDESGKLWMRRKIETAVQEKAEDTLTLSVYRLLQDKIPMQDNTLLRLRVTGQVREVSIGPVLQGNAVPLQVSSPLPARLEDNGMLRIQVKPGIWDVMVRSRYIGKQDTLTFKGSASPWPKEEVWSFQSQNELRLVEIEGGQSLDPQQTNMPNEWKESPAYLMKSESTLKIIEKRRGQEKHRWEPLNLDRKMWLDFSGKGYILQDRLSGTIEDHWRLSVLPLLHLGRVTINGKDNLITKIGDEPPGVEIRQGQLDLLAVSRIAERTTKLPAVGWDVDVRSLSTTLFLPPGWMLLGAWGVDSVTHAWVQDWTLLDLFLVLIMATATMKLLGARWGALALFTLVLIYREPGSPVYSWLNIIAALALVKALPVGKALTWMNYYFRFSFVILVLIALPFMVKQIREAIYPQLTVPKISYMPSSQTYAAKAGAGRMLGAPLSPQVALEAVSESAAQVKSFSDQNLYERKEKGADKPIQEYDPDAKIQTGPGVPNWQWDTYQLNWNGPVLKDQKMKLWLIPAWLTSVLKITEVIFMVLLMYGLSLPWRDKNGTFRSNEMTKSPSKLMSLSYFAAFALGAYCSLTPYDAWADFPDPALLEDLRTRLLEPAECLPDCANIGRMQIEASPTQLTIRFSAHAAVKTAIPIPSTQAKWVPRTVLIDGKASMLQTDEQQQLWLLLEPGVHEVVAEGPIGNQDSFAVNVPLSPSFVSANVQGWNIEGIVRHQLQTPNFYLTRIKAVDEPKQKTPSFEPGRIPPFVVYTRTFKLGIDWEIVNELRREAPQQGAISMALPLMNDESVLSDNVDVKEGKVFVGLSADQRNIVWKSKLKVTPQIHLEASADPSVKEIWQLDAIAMWHCSFEGIPMIHQQSRQGRWFPTWAPWPKETLDIQVIRPEAVSGNTLTIDNSRLSVTPGKRSSENVLSFTTRSSQGGNHSIVIPKEALLQDVLINGLSQPINVRDGEIVVPLNPGTQQIDVKWQSNQGIQYRFITPKVNLNVESSNAVIDLQLSKDRWILLLGGPAIGPAVLFWGILAALFLLSVGLGRSKLTPLRSWQWFLLGTGLVVATPFTAIVVIAWFAAMQKRGQLKSDISPSWFQWMQVGLVILTIFFVVSLFASISDGLLGTPQMQLGSPASPIVQSYFGSPVQYQLQWYQDISQNALPEAWVISLPLYVYRILMLLWALWVAFSLVQWMRWGWQSFSVGGLWKREVQQGEAKTS